MSFKLRVIAVGVCVLASTMGSVTGSSAAAPPALRFESSSVLASNADASPDLLAGSHPYALTTSFALATTTNLEGRLLPEGGDLKDLAIELPPGVGVDPLATPRCGAAEFASVNSSTDEDGCPSSSAVGIVAIENVKAPTLSERQVSVYPIYDLTPPQGSPALLGFRVAGTAVYLAPSVRTGGDYGLTVAMKGMPQDVHVLGGTVTFWGVPAEPAHDEQRGDCIQSHGTCPAGVSPRPFLTLPTQCLTPPSALLSADSWQEPEQLDALATDPITGSEQALTACGMLDFSPSFDSQTESSTAGAPTGLRLHVQIPGNEDPTGLGEAELKDAVLTLPPGMALNLSRAGGLVGCPLEGPEGINLRSSEPASCPGASKIGSVRIRTSMLAEELQGGLYLAQQGNLPGNGTNPFKSLLAVYLLAEGSGVVVKLPGEVTADRQTGQLTIHLGPDPITGESFAPQLSLEEIEIELSGGSDGVLVTPATCGSYSTSASLTPWSGAAPATLAVDVEVTQRCGKAFNPSFSAGTVDKRAGGYSTLTTTLALQDGEQELKSMSLTTPAGLQATLKGVELCPEPQASLGTCGAASLIGEATSTMGAGAEPFVLTGGRVYLTGPYRGAPFGLSLVMPAVAGPFNLGPEGRPLVIRSAIQIDPITGKNTVVTDADGPYSIPSILEGIAPQIKTVKIDIDRPQFTFNPTTCAPQPITGVARSVEGATESVSAPFEATDCASLPFSPRLRTSTVGRPSRPNGIGFDVKIVQGVAGEANAQSIKVDLPKRLPSRLTTLQKACPAAIFATDPAGCPAGSIVGTADAVTPILPVPMTGPAYFVSHGGAKFPELVIVLQGYGVTIELYGETFISKAGVTSSTFPAIPDAPVSSFELRLPAGSNSALTAHGNLCANDLRTPTLIIAQNGAVIREDPRVAVSGCPPSIKVIRHSVRGPVARIVVSVPSAGTLTATGRGLSRVTKKVGKAGTITVRLRLKRAQRLQTQQHDRRQRVAVRLMFLTRHGRRLSGHVVVLLR
jgi:hypothetical protein